MRNPSCYKEDTGSKGAWSKQEDQKLTEYIRIHGEGCWTSLPRAAGLLHSGKSCRLRWINCLRPDAKPGNFGEDEEDLIIRLHALLGNRWSLIAGRLPGRTENEVKTYWNSHLRRKLTSMGIDPNNHRLNQNQSFHVCREVKHQLGSPASNCQLSDSASSLDDNGTGLPDLNRDLTVSLPSPKETTEAKEEV